MRGLLLECPCVAHLEPRLAYDFIFRGRNQACLRVIFVGSNTGAVGRVDFFTIL